MITAHTDGYTANRDIMFNGKCNIVLEQDLTFKEAKRRLLDMYNKKFEDERAYAKNWGIAVLQSAPYIHGACKTFSDGTRSFSWDGRTFSIKKMEEEE